MPENQKLTIIDPITKITLPSCAVHKADEWVNVGAAGTAPDNHSGRYHRQLLEEEKN